MFYVFNYAATYLVKQVKEWDIISVYICISSSYLSVLSFFTTNLKLLF